MDDRIEAQIDERGERRGEGAAGGRGRKDEMKDELSAEGLMEEEQGHTSKILHNTELVQSSDCVAPSPTSHFTLPLSV